MIFSRIISIGLKYSTNWVVTKLLSLWFLRSSFGIRFIRLYGGRWTLPITSSHEGRKATRHHVLAILEGCEGGLFTQIWNPRFERHFVFLPSYFVAPWSPRVLLGPDFSNQEVNQEDKRNTKLRIHHEIWHRQHHPCTAHHEQHHRVWQHATKVEAFRRDEIILLLPWHQKHRIWKNNRRRWIHGCPTNVRPYFSHWTCAVNIYPQLKWRFVRSCKLAEALNFPHLVEGEVMGNNR